MKQLILIPTLFIFLFACCKKKNNSTQTLPPATQTGKNTFGCEIDGNVITTSGYKSGWLTDEGLRFYFGSESNIIIEIFTLNPRRKIKLEFVYDGNIGNYPSYSKVGSYTYSCSVLDSIDKYGTIIGGTNYYITDTNNNGNISITHFTGDISLLGQVGDIISGTFNIKLANNNNKIIHLSNGRFDIKMQ